MRRAFLTLVVCWLLVSSGRAENYAVLFAGGVRPAKNHQRYYLATNSTYWKLTETLHFLPENVHVLAADGTDPGLDQNLHPDDSVVDLVDSDWSSITGNGSSVLTATGAQLEAILNSLPLEPRDTLFLWTYDHGSGEEADHLVVEEEELCGWYDDITCLELAQYCDGLNAGRQAYVFGQCYAGGMLAALETHNGVGTLPGTFGCAATNHYEVSFSNTTTGFMQAFSQGIVDYRTNTESLYQYALANTPAATDGEGPGGTWHDPNVDQVQHPWMIGDDFDLAVANWGGYQNGSWTDPDNWSDMMEPNSDRTVRITGTGYDAAVTSAVNPIRQLRVCSGANLRVAGGGILQVTGDLENDGSILVTNAHLDVDGQIDCTETASHLGLGSGGLVYAGELHTAGRVGVGDFSLLHVYSDLTISGDGEVEVHDGGTLLVDQDIVMGPTSTLTARDNGSIVGVNHLKAGGTVNFNSGSSLDVAGTLYAGKYWAAQVAFTGAQVDVGGQMIVADGTPATVTASNSTVNVFSLVQVGNAAEGTLELYGSHLEAMYLHVGDTNKGHLKIGDVDRPGSTVKLGGANPTFIVGNQAGGDVVQYAGHVTRANNDIDFPDVTLGHDVEGSGTYTLYDGTLTAKRLTVGHEGSGKFYQYGGQVTVHDTFRLASQASSNGSYCLAGGTLKVPDVTSGLGDSELDIDGGTLSLTGSSVDVGTLKIASGSGTVGQLALVGKSLTANVISIGSRGQGTCHLTGCTTTVSTLRVAFTGTGSLQQTAGSLNASYLYVGDADGATGTYRLQGGSVTVASQFEIGNSHGSTGTFELNAGMLATPETVVGKRGTGTLRQADGIHDVAGTLTLGDYGSDTERGQGTYELSGGAVASTGSVVGGGGSGSFIQTGGTHDVAGTLTLGLDADSTGEYQLQAGNLRTTGTLVGEAGLGTFAQSGGMHAINGDLTVGRSGSSSSYTLDGPISVKLIQENLYVGRDATAEFVHHGGLNHVTQDLVLGHGAGAHGTYRLGGGTLAVDGHIYLGYAGGTGTFEIDGPTVAGLGTGLQISGPACTLSGWGVIDKEVVNAGTLDAHSGTLTIRRRYVGRGGLSIDDSGQLTLEDDASISGHLLNDGTLLVAGGTTEIISGMTGGPAAVVSVDVPAQLRIVSDASMHILKAQGTVRQLAGTTTVDSVVELDGSYELAGGATLDSANSGIAGTFSHGGGTHSCDVNNIGGLGGTAVYSISAGSLEMVELNLGMHYSGVEGPGMLDIADAGAYVEVSGTFNHYTGGSISTVPGAQIHMTGSIFNNYSTDPAGMPGLANLEMIFEGCSGVTDTFEVAGRDLGDQPGGLMGNFVLGTLTLGSTAGVGQVRLVDSFDNQPGWQGGEVLYVKNLVLQSGSRLDLGGVDVYYQRLVNLGGTIELGGGSLNQLVPEPAAGLLVALGAVILLLRRRRQ